MTDRVLLATILEVLDALQVLELAECLKRVESIGHGEVTVRVVKGKPMFISEKLEKRLYQKNEKVL